MGAEVAGCGHAKCFMEIDYLGNSPQIHLHFLSDDDFYDEYGYGKTEICCHGCNASILLYYTKASARRNEHVCAKDVFRKKHMKCENRKFETECPAFRSSTEIVDLRRKKKTTKKRALTKTK